MNFFKEIIKKYFFLIKLFVGIGILFLLIKIFDVNFIQALKGIKFPIYIYLALVIPVIINPIISNNRWKIFLSELGINESFLTLVRISFVSIFLGIALPATSGSDAIRIYQIEKRNKHIKGAGGASVVIERLLGFFLLSFLGIVGAIFAFYNGISIIVLLVTLFLNISILFIFIVLKNSFLFKKITVFLSKIKKGKVIVDYMNSAYSSVNRFPLKKVLLSTVPLIFAFQLSTIICGYLLFLSFGVNIPFYYHLAFLPLIQIMSIIPVSISGFGIREGGFLYFYNFLGVNENVSFLVSLLYYAVLMLVPAFIGLFLYLFERNPFNKKIIISNKL